MSSFQRLLLGIAIGGMVAIFSFPNARHLLLHLTHTRAIQEEILSNELSSDTGPIHFEKSVDKMDVFELLNVCTQIARRMNTNRNAFVEPSEYKKVKDFLRLAEQRDPDNSLFPQLTAIAAAQAGEMDEAGREWRRSSSMRRWNNGSTEAMNVLWKAFSLRENFRNSAQGLLALQFRSTDTTSLILRASQSSVGPGSNFHSDIIRKAYTILNLSKLRDGTSSLEAGMSAHEIILALATVESFRRAMKPGEMEREQQIYVDALRTLGHPALSQEIRRELRRNFAWTAILKPEEDIASIKSQVTLNSLLCSSLPSVLFFSSLILGGIAYIGSAVNGMFGNVPHPDKRYVIGFSLFVGIFAFFLTQLWLFSIWVLFLGVLLATPIESASLATIEFSAKNRVVINVLTVASLGAICICCFSMTPSASVLGYGENVELKLFAMPSVWQPLAFLVVSLTVPFSALWAWQKQRAMFYLLGNVLKNVALNGCILGAFFAVVSTPICMLADNGNSKIIEQWMVDEPTSFGIDQP